MEDIDYTKTFTEYISKENTIKWKIITFMRDDFKKMMPFIDFDGHYGEENRRGLMTVYFDSPSNRKYDVIKIMLSNQYSKIVN